MIAQSKPKGKRTFTPEQKEQYLPRVADGSKIAAFALSEPNAGSDVSAMETYFQTDQGKITINGTKTWISNGGIADFYTVFARSGSGGPISAVIVDAESEGLNVTERIEVIAPHPLATLEFDNCVVSQSQILGEEGKGMRTALSTLDIFRTTVGAAALGLARRALDEATKRAVGRQMFGASLSDLPIAQATLAEMALDIDAAALLIYRSAWTKDVKGKRVTKEAAMAKLKASVIAVKASDDAVQILGGYGYSKDFPVERYFRDAKITELYEGTSEIQKLVIARQLFLDK